MAAAYPNRVAISNGDAFLTYRQLHHLAVINSRELRKLVPEGSAVLLLNRREIDTYVGMLSILYAGCFYSPLKVDWPKEKISQIVELLEPSLIVGPKEGVEKLYSEIPKMKTIGSFNAVLEASFEDKNDSPIEVSNSSLAYVLFTSGSTGLPKRG